MRNRIYSRRPFARRWHVNPDHLSGGLSEGHTEDEFDPRQLDIGEEIELEHTRDRKVARQIAMDHLVELPDYYTWLRAMELLAEQERGPFRKRAKKARRNNDDLEDEPTEEIDLTAERIKKVSGNQQDYFDIIGKTARSLSIGGMKRRYGDRKDFGQLMTQHVASVVAQWTLDEALASGLAFTAERNGKKRIFLDLGPVRMGRQGPMLQDRIMTRLTNSLNKVIPMVLAEEVEARKVFVQSPQDGEKRKEMFEEVTLPAGGMRHFEDVYIRGHQLSAGSGRLMAETDQDLESRIVEASLKKYDPNDVKLISLHTGYGEVPAEWRNVTAFKTIRRISPEGRKEVVSLPREHIRLYHTPDCPPEDCPTCRAINRKMPDYSVKQVRDLVDNYLEELRSYLVRMVMPPQAKQNRRR